MLVMSGPNFLRARDYLSDHGRPLEQALFRYHFEGGISEAVLAVLEQHQSADGGFAGMGEGDALGRNMTQEAMDALEAGRKGKLPWQKST